MAGRFERHERVAVDDGWDIDEEVAPTRTEVAIERPRSIIARNQSPDIPFDRSINPYRGCEHGCIYCFARPTHSFLGLSPGLDFETKLTAKPEAARVLRAELSRRGYRPGGDGDGHQHRPLPAAREEARHHPRDPRRARATSATRSRS